MTGLARWRSSLLRGATQLDRSVAGRLDRGDQRRPNAVFLQFGEFAFSLEVDNAPLETVTDLATIQLECLEDGICLAPIPMPAL